MEEHTQHTEHTESPAAEHEAFYLEPVFWVAISFCVFMVLAIRPLVVIITNALDARAKQIADELAEARRLREEAAAVLASYQKKQQESLQEAEAMLASTRADATRIIDKAEADLKLALDRRMKMAADRIAQAEVKALQDVQERVTDIALAAAQKLIVDHLAKGGDEELIRKVSSDVAAKIH